MENKIEEKNEMKIEEKVAAETPKVEDREIAVGAKDSTEMNSIGVGDGTEKVYRQSGIVIACYVLAAVMLIYAFYTAGNTVHQINEYYGSYEMSASWSEYFTYVLQAALEPLLHVFTIFMAGYILNTIRKQDPNNYVAKKQPVAAMANAEMVNAAMSDVAATVEEGVKTVVEVATEVKEELADKVEDIKEDAAEIKEKAADKLESIKEDAAEKLDEIKKETAEKLEELKNKEEKEESAEKTEE